MISKRIFLLLFSAIVTVSSQKERFLDFHENPYDHKIKSDYWNDHVVVLKSHLQKHDTFAVADDIMRMHDDEQFKEFHAPVAHVFEHVKMNVVRNPSPEALEHLKKDPRVEGVYKTQITWGAGKSFRGVGDSAQSLSDAAQMAAKTADELYRGVTEYLAQETYDLIDNMSRYLEATFGDAESQQSNKRITPLFFFCASDVFLDGSPYTYNIDRVDTRAENYDCTQVDPYYAMFDAERVDVFVLDSGAQITHDEFAGDRKIKLHSTYFQDDDDINHTAENNDGWGHGTHVASTIVGVSQGVARKANMRAIKVLNDVGAGSTLFTIGALNEVIAHKTLHPNKRIVVNMSLYSAVDTPTNNACANAAAAGIALVASAGNEADDACNYSPGVAADVINVGASQWEDKFDTAYSNHGTCIDIIAPGTGVKGACPPSSVLGPSCTGTNSYVRLQGTSFAAPLVAGVIALLMRANVKHMGFFPTKAEARSVDSSYLKLLLQCTATTGALTELPTDTPDYLLYLPRKFGEGAKACVAAGRRKLLEKKQQQREQQQEQQGEQEQPGGME